MNSLKYYLKVFSSFVKNTFVREIDYRANFIADFLDSLFNFIVSYIFFDAIYLNVDTIAGWNKWETILLVGTSQLITAIIYTLFMNNLPRLQNYILSGYFDYVSLKPCDEQFYVSFRYFYFGGLSSIVMSVALIVYAIMQLKLSITIVKLFIYILLIMSGVCICYSIWFIIMTCSIIFIKIGQIHEIFLSLLKFMEYPKDIYKKISKYIFMFVIPLATIANIPVNYLISKITLLNSIYTFVLALIFICLARKFWKSSLNKYQSASS